MKTRSLIPAVMLPAVLFALAMPVGAASRIWLGETALWSDPDNWSPNGVPQNGDFLTFPDDGNPFTVRSMNNDLANLSLNTITFTGGGYTLDGNVLTLGQGITDNHSGALNRVRCGIQFTIGDGRFNSLDIGQLEVSGTTTLANNQDLIVTPLVTNLTVSWVIQGDGGLVKRGAGALFLRGSAANTYTGPTRVQGGRMHLAKTSAARAISADELTVSFSPMSPQITSVVFTTNRLVQITGQAKANSLYGIEVATNLTPPIFWQRWVTNTADAPGGSNSRTPTRRRSRCGSIACCFPAETAPKRIGLT